MTLSQEMRMKRCKDSEKIHSEYCMECDGFCIESVPFLEGLPVKKQQRLLERAVHAYFKKGETIFNEGQHVDAIYLIQKGKVKLSTYDGDGREMIVGIFAEHDTIWEGIFLENSKYPYTCVCISDALICIIKRTELESEIQDPAMALKVIGMLSMKLHDANERNLLLSTSSPKARIAGFLLYRKERTAERAVKLKLEDIAASVSLRPETVSRKLKELEREGIIKKTGQSSIEIINFSELRSISGI